jgi:diguanylate cyclase (GGDEF)-like protein
MKIDRTSPVRGARAVAAAAYARRAEQAAPVSSVLPVSATANVLGIPDSEFTPRVRDAIMRLMSEVDSLRQELHQTQSRLESVEKTADQDQLLPILNRRAFVRELTRHIALAGRYGTPASLVYFDLNDFKTVNDTYGHAVGDTVLSHFAQTLIANVRESDIVGRLGGDEFGVLLSHATQEQAHRKADQLASVLRAAPIIAAGQNIEVRFAYGAFELRGGENADSAMARADEAMYANKRAAR